MEHPQQRLLGNQGRKPTHDFLSLYSPAQQDPSATTTTPPSGSYLETHDFLQPLERVRKNVSKEENKVEESSIGKSLPPAPPTTVEHTLPGGIGTYSISHISVINQSQRVPKPEGVGVVITGAQSSGSDRNDENSNCSSYTGSGFSLWEESAVQKGKTGKENIAGNRHVIREGGVKMGGMPWMTSMERPSQSSSAHNHPTATISSLSTSRPSSAPKNASFVDMLKSAKSVQEDEDEEVEEFVIKKEPSTHYKGVLSVKVDTAHHDQKPNTPRSKHSATEQRRRSKINDRFSMLRELIPHGDQKRDKASFLLEVIEYIQFLQEKVHKFEDSCRGWTNEQPAMTAWQNNNQRPTEGFIDQPRVQNGVPGSALPYASKLNENKHSAALNLPKKDHQHLLDSDLSSLETMKEIGQHPRLTNLASPFPSPLQPNVYSPGCGSTSVAAPLPSTLPSDTTNAPSQLWQSRSCTTDCTIAADKSKDQDLTIESGTISISTIYSQGLLSTLTQALQSSGVDLSEANISVQIDLGKRANTSSRDSLTPIFKKSEAPAIDENLARSRLASTREEKSDKDLKRFKTSRN